MVTVKLAGQLGRYSALLGAYSFINYSVEPPCCNERFRVKRRRTLRRINRSLASDFAASHHE